MSQELVVQTIPSYRPGLLSRKTDTPHRRIVAMEIGGRTVWMPRRWPDRVNGYDPAAARTEVVEVSARLALGAQVFFEHCMGDTTHNCHSFADFMEGTQPQGRQMDADGLAAAWQAGEHPLAMGQRGVIWGIRRASLRREQFRPYHSVIGLGEENPDCLQLTQAGGFMALDTYDAVLAYYRAGAASDAAALYTRRPPNGMAAA